PGQHAVPTAVKHRTGRQCRPRCNGPNDPQCRAQQPHTQRLRQNSFQEHPCILICLCTRNSSTCRRLLRLRVLLHHPDIEPPEIEIPDVQVPPQPFHHEFAR